MSVYNATATSAANWRDALARQEGGGAVARLNCIGDSITEGYSATGNHLTAPWSRKLLTRLQASDPDHSWRDGQEWFTAVNASYPDPHRVFGTDWFINNGGEGPAAAGTLGQTNGATSAGTFDFGPVLCDSFTVWWRNVGQGGRFTWKVDGGAESAQIETNSGVTGLTAPWVALTIPCGSVGLHTLKLKAYNPSGKVTGFLAVRWDDSTDPGAVLASVGRFGADTYNYASSASSLRDTFDYTQGDLSIIFLGTNDNGAIGAGHGATPSVVAANLQTMIDRARAASGDVVLVVPPPIQAGLMSGYSDAMYALADSADVALVDLSARWGTWANAVASGFLPNSVDVHPTEAGHADIALAMEEAVLAMSGIDTGGEPPPASGWTDVVSEKWNGTAWEDVIAEKWDGSAWAPAVFEKAN